MGGGIRVSGTITFHSRKVNKQRQAENFSLEEFAIVFDFVLLRRLFWLMELKMIRKWGGMCCERKSLRKYAIMEDAFLALSSLFRAIREMLNVSHSISQPLTIQLM